MSIPKEVVKHIAELSRIELEEEEIEYYTSQLAKILTYVEKINELNLKEVSFEFSIHHQANIYRKDKIEKFSNPETIVEIFPQREKGFIKVPKVIEQG